MGGSRAKRWRKVEAKAILKQKEHVSSSREQSKLMSEMQISQATLSTTKHYAASKQNFSLLQQYGFVCQSSAHWRKTKKRKMIRFSARHRQKRNNLHPRHGSAPLKFCFISDPLKRFRRTIVQSLAQLGSRWRGSWEREKRLHRGSESNPITSDSSLNFTTERVWWNLGTTVELHYHPA